MLRAVVANVMIILNVCQWSWACLCCIWKVPNLSKQPVNAL